MDLGRERLVDRVALDRLSLEGSAGLLDTLLPNGHVSPDLAPTLYRYTEGNPFFTEEVVRELRERGDIFLENDLWSLRTADDIEVPESIRAVVSNRVARLSSSAQDVLTEASVLGQAFSFDDLLALSGRKEDELDDALEEAAATGLIRQSRGDDYSVNPVSRSTRCTRTCLPESAVASIPRLGSQ
jgi:predicted ATPase